MGKGEMSAQGCTERWTGGMKEGGEGRKRDRERAGRGKERGRGRRRGKKLRATDVSPLDIKERTAFMGKAGKQRREGEEASTETDRKCLRPPEISPYYFLFLYLFIYLI